MDEEVGPIFIVDQSDEPALHQFAGKIGGRLETWQLIDGDDQVLGARLLGTAGQMSIARRCLYLGLSGLPPHIKPLWDW
ncbi:hypothetical protein [Methylobacterium flocculans]|uniref:hypothetical protein n=1 Tax=Methylobacterium flocculans TaxID=2984843 RepID=UPI0021F3C127|nr:hypothetical protein [Methylobacterium sp. FF17]